MAKDRPVDADNLLLFDGILRSTMAAVAAAACGYPTGEISVPDPRIIPSPFAIASHNRLLAISVYSHFTASSLPPADRRRGDGRGVKGSSFTLQPVRSASDFDLFCPCDFGLGDGKSGMSVILR